MCGIAGIVHEDATRPVETDVLDRMCASLRHRGPDDTGRWAAPGVGLAHTRLSVIDLSPAGHQPLTNEDESVRVVYNGEIYNFRELRRELEERGHRFRSATDTEVIVHLYEDEGEACVERLHGMFALAVWDARRRRLLLARDRLGKKPLKYCAVGGGIAFASELKALIAGGLIDRDPDLAAIDRFLTFGYVPGPATGITGVHKLPPAHRLVWEAGSVRLERYWELDYSRKVERSGEEWQEAIRETVTRAVRRRLISDVPLGAYLSGGIDSSIVVACMAEESSRPVETFSIGFSHERYNELPFARDVAARFGTSHHEHVVEADTAALLPELAALYEEPYADASALPSWLLARETRRSVTVALTGDGGDEAFAGYPRYARVHDWEARVNWARRSGIRTLASLVAGTNGRALPSRLARRAELVESVSHPDLGRRYAWMLRHFSDREKAALYGAPLRPLLERSAGELFSELAADPRAGSGALDRMLFLDTHSYLPDDLLVKLDLASMAHGLEARSPLLDHEVLELAASIPPELKYRRGELKWLLREAFRGRIPDGVLDRPKQGFEIPLNDWFRGPLSPLLDELVLAPDARLRRLLRPAGLELLVREHREQQFDHGRRLWALTMLELWLRG